MQLCCRILQVYLSVIIIAYIRARFCMNEYLINVSKSFLFRISFHYNMSITLKLYHLNYTQIPRNNYNFFNYFLIGEFQEFFFMTLVLEQNLKGVLRGVHRVLHYFLY